MPNWKILAGARWDKFSGDYISPATATVGRDSRAPAPTRSGAAAAACSTSRATQLTFYASYGTSFNTSGELYNYDAAGLEHAAGEEPNIEVGVKSDLFDGNLSARAAIFKTTKYNERNRDSPDGVPLDDYLLSGKRHASGVDLDLAGRITPQWEVYLSYEWIPIAKIDEVQGVTLTGELEGQRPSMTPRHSGSLFTTYQVNPRCASAAGLNARSSQTPNRNPPGIVAPGFVTYDLFGRVRVHAADPRQDHRPQRHQQALRRLALHGALHSRSAANPVRFVDGALLKPRAPHFRRCCCMSARSSMPTS